MTGPITELSPAQRVIERLVELGEEAPRALEALLSRLTREEQAALAFEWEDFWARPKQLPPDGTWRSWGGLTGKGWGKTFAMAKHVTCEVMAGRAPRVGLIAQNEDKVWEVMIEGNSGLIACSPPWFKARTLNGNVVWPNGAKAYVYTPERPGDIHGPEHNLGWASELHVWPKTTREQAWANFDMGLRLGYGRLIWDSNPSKRHPIIRKLMDRAARNPRRHIVFRGTTYENEANLTAGAIEEWEQEYGGTQRGRELLLGEQFDEDEGALVKQAWIDDHRRMRPDRFSRRVLSIDPAISLRPGTDATGIVDAGLGLDDQFLVLEDLSERYAWEAWGRLAGEEYFRRRCDCLIIERNRGGDSCVANLRTAGHDLGFVVIVLPLEASCPGHTPGVMHVKEVVSRDSKDARLEAVAPLYERGRVSHCWAEGISFDELEDQLTTFEPGPRVQSPNAMDSVVHALWELAGLWNKAPNVRSGFKGIGTAQRILAQPKRAQVISAISGALYKPSGRGGRL